MIKRNSLLKGVLLFSGAVIVWCCTFIIEAISPQLVNWFCDNGNLPTTEAAMIVALLYMIATYFSVMLIIPSLTQFLHEKSFFECVRHQAYRYFAFWCVLPLAIVSMGWGILRPYLSLKPNINSMLDITTAFCDFALFFSIVFAIASVVGFAYGLLIRSSVYFNAVCGVISPLYICYTAFIVSVNFEYGKWFLLFVMICCLIEVTLFIIHKKTNKNILIPKYEIVVFPIDDDEEYKIAVDNEEYDFSIFMPKENKGE